MSTNVDEHDEPSLSDVITHVLKIGSDYEWNEIQIATAIHGVVAPIAVSDAVGCRDVSIQLAYLAGELRDRLEQLEDQYGPAWIGLGNLMAPGEGQEDFAARLLARNLTAGFGSVGFLRLESVVLRALEIIQKAESDHV